MKKKELKKIAKKYGMNYRALKACIIESGYELKETLYGDVLSIAMANVPDLMYTRVNGTIKLKNGEMSDTIEYLNGDKLDTLIEDYEVYTKSLRSAESMYRYTEEETH